MTIGTETVDVGRLAHIHGTLERRLPAGWKLTTLGEAFRWGSGGTPLRTNSKFFGGSIPWLVIGDLNDGVVTAAENTITEEGLANSSAKWVEPGSVLLAMYGSIGKLGIAGTRLTTNQAIAFADSGSVNAKYLFYYLLWKRKDLATLGKGATQKNISQTVIKAFPFVLAPSNEQVQIVSEIEKQFSRLDEAVASVRNAEGHLSAYRASVLSAVQSGALCGINCNDWPIRTIGELATKVQYGSSAKTSATGKGIPVLRMGNIEHGELVVDKLKYLPADHDEFPELLLEVGDLLFNRTNSPELVGKVAVYQGNPNPCSFASYLIRLRFADDVVPKFVAYVLNSPYGRAWVRSVVTQQVGQANVNGSKLKAFHMRVPPIAQQRRLVAEAERQFSLMRETEVQLEAAELRSENLRSKLLANAFGADNDQ